MWLVAEMYSIIFVHEFAHLKTVNIFSCSFFFVLFLLVALQVAISHVFKHFMARYKTTDIGCS